MFIKQSTLRPIVIPCGSKPVPVFIIKNILKQLEMSNAEFLDALRSL